MKKIIFATALLSINVITKAQMSMVAEFATIPTLPTSAKDAFARCSTSVSKDKTVSYIQASNPIIEFQQKIINDSKPLQTIILAEGNKKTPQANSVVNDYSYLSSAEMQAKMAKMTQEEKMKFAMELRQKMNGDKNVQTFNVKPNLALLAEQQKVNDAYNTLMSTINNPYTFKEESDKCNFNCKEYNDDACYKKTDACRNKEAHELFLKNIANYDAYLKTATATYNAAKVTFITTLTSFDAVAKNATDIEQAQAQSPVLGNISMVNEAIKNIEQNGASIIIGAKNNQYTKNEY